MTTFRGDASGHETADVVITGVVNNGYGIARVDGRVCFTPGGLPGDHLRVALTDIHKGVYWARILEVLTPSPARREAPCPVFGQCGGCEWLHFTYPEQAEWKRQMLMNTLERIGGMACEAVGWAEDPEWRLGSRTRARFHCDGERWGLYERHSNQVIPLPGGCALCHPHLNAAFTRLCTLHEPGEVELTVNPEDGMVMAFDFTGIPALGDLFEHVNVIRRPGERSGFLFDGMPIVNGAFSQSSLLLNRVLRRVVWEMTGEPDRLLDLYCGNGNFSLPYATRGKVLGMDQTLPAVQAANRLAPGSYRQGAEKMFVRALNEPWDAVLLDPPRAGAKAIIPALAAARTERIIYVSCNPATLARDVGLLSKSGWRVTEATAVDMFPHTWHMETVCRLERG